MGGFSKKERQQIEELFEKRFPKSEFEKLKKFMDDHDDMKEALEAYGISPREFIESSPIVQAAIFNKNYEEFKKKYQWQPPKPIPDPEPDHNCKEGQVWSDTEKKCVDIPQPSGGEKDKNGVVYMALPSGYKIINESNSPTLNDREDGTRYDFKDKIRVQCELGGYITPHTSLAGEELAFKFLGTHDSAGNNSGTYVVGVKLDGTQVRLRKEIHNDYTNTIRAEKKNLQNMYAKTTGFYGRKINTTQGQVLIEIFIDENPFDENGKPANNWKLIYTILDDGNLATGKWQPIWLTESVKGRSQNTLRVDKAKSDKKMDIKFPFCREISTG